MIYNEVVRIDGKVMYASRSNNGMYCEDTLPGPKRALVGHEPRDTGAYASEEGITTS